MSGFGCSFWFGAFCFLVRFPLPYSHRSLARGSERGVTAGWELKSAIAEVRGVHQVAMAVVGRADHPAEDFQAAADRQEAVALQGVGEIQMTIAISQEERQRIETAIKSAESRTSAEIFAVLAERSDDYRFVAYGFIGLWVFVFSIILALFMEWQDIRLFEGAWTKQSFPLLLFVLAQGSAFGTGILAFRLLPSLYRDDCS